MKRDAELEITVGYLSEASAIAMRNLNHDPDFVRPMSDIASNAEIQELILSDVPCGYYVVDEGKNSVTTGNRVLLMF